MSESLHPSTSPPVCSRSVVLTQPQSAVRPSVSVAWPRMADSFAVLLYFIDDGGGDDYDDDHEEEEEEGDVPLCHR